MFRRSDASCGQAPKWRTASATPRRFSFSNAGGRGTRAACRGKARRDERLKAIAEVARLVPSDGYWRGRRFGLGDIAVGSLLDYISLRLPEIDWSAKYANLVGLRKRLSQRPSFRDTEPRVQQIDTGVV